MTPHDAPLADGMPVLGLGTWQNRTHDQCAESVRTALEAGYRHVDTAQAYGNEAAVGDGVAAADVDREDAFLATKVWHDSLGYRDVLDSTEASLDRLGTSYVDLLYVHWPANTYDPVDTFRALADLHDDGLVHRVGVSNFTPDLLDEAVETCDVPIFAHQFECHPLFGQRELRAHTAELGVEVVAYSPLARGRVFDDPVVTRVAEKHGVSAAQVSLAWLRQRDATAIPKATGAEHIRDNLASLDLALDEEDLAAIDGIDRSERVVDPGFAPW